MALSHYPHFLIKISVKLLLAFPPLIARTKCRPLCLLLAECRRRHWALPAPHLCAPIKAISGLCGHSTVRRHTFPCTMHHFSTSRALPCVCLLFSPERARSSGQCGPSAVDWLRLWPSFGHSRSGSSLPRLTNESHRPSWRLWPMPQLCGSSFQAAPGPLYPAPLASSSWPRPWPYTRPTSRQSPHIPSHPAGIEAIRTGLLLLLLGFGCAVPPSHPPSLQRRPSCQPCG